MVISAAEPDDDPTVIRTHVTGTGSIHIEPQAELRIQSGAIVDLSGGDPLNPPTECPEPGAPEQWGTITVEGVLFVQDSAIQNTNIEVRLAEFEGDTDITLLEAAEGFGGEFFVEGSSFMLKRRDLCTQKVQNSRLGTPKQLCMLRMLSMMRAVSVADQLQIKG